MRNFTEVAKELAAILIAYGGIIRVARRNLNEAMGKLVDAFHTKVLRARKSLAQVADRGVERGFRGGAHLRHRRDGRGRLWRGVDRGHQQGA